MASIPFLIFFVAYVLLTPNLHSIDEDLVYRSRQLTPEYLQKIIKDKNIKTVVNLRGYHPEKKWYRDEERVAKDLGIRLINIPMTATRIPRRSTLLKIFEAFDTAEKPFLIHCQAGADRTGLVSALYFVEELGYGTAEASKEMLRWQYGHLKQRFPAMTYFMKIYQGRDWAEKYYFPCSKEANYDHFNKSKVCRQELTVVDDEHEDQPLLWWEEISR